MDYQIIAPSPRHPLPPSLKSDHHLSRAEKEAPRKDNINQNHAQ